MARKPGATPDYTKKAIRKYNEKFDRVAVNLPKGTKDRIKQLTGLSCNKYICELVLADLDRMTGDASADRGKNNSAARADTDHSTDHV